MLHHVERLTNRVAGWLAIAASLCLLLVMGLSVSDAVLRYGIDRPIPAALELTQMLLPVLIFAALPHVTAQQRHVVVSSITDRLPGPARSASLRLGQLALTAMLGVVTWQMAVLGLDYLADARTTLSARLPVFPFVACCVASLAVATFASAIGCISKPPAPFTASSPKSDPA